MYALKINETTIIKNLDGFSENYIIEGNSENSIRVFSAYKNGFNGNILDEVQNIIDNEITSLKLYDDESYQNVIWQSTVYKAINNARIEPTDGINNEFAIRQVIEFRIK